MVQHMLAAYGSISLALGLYVIFESNRSKIKLMESAKTAIDKTEMQRAGSDASEMTYNIGAVLTLLGIVMNFFAA